MCAICWMCFRFSHFGLILGSVISFVFHNLRNFFRGVFKTLSNIQDGIFWQNTWKEEILWERKYRESREFLTKQKFKQKFDRIKCQKNSKIKMSHELKFENYWKGKKIRLKMQLNWTKPFQFITTTQKNTQNVKKRGR